MLAKAEFDFQFGNEDTRCLQKHSLIFGLGRKILGVSKSRVRFNFWEETFLLPTKYQPLLAPAQPPIHGCRKLFFVGEVHKKLDTTHLVDPQLEMFFYRMVLNQAHGQLEQ